MEENVNRNKRIYELRSLGYTIEEISLMTGIPRSTVGYYVKKFKKYENEGKPLKFTEQSISVGRSEPASSNALGSLLMKWMGFQAISKWIIGLLSSGEFEKLYYLLMSLKCAFELGKYFKLTPEELKLSEEILSAFKVEEPKSNLGKVGRQIPSLSEANMGKPRKSLKEILQQQTENDEEQDRIK